MCRSRVRAQNPGSHPGTAAIARIHVTVDRIQANCLIERMAPLLPGAPIHRCPYREIPDMFSRRAVLVSLGALSLSAAVPAQAAEIGAYAPDAFKAALGSGKPVLVAIHAVWCPTCKAQAPILEGLLATRFRDMVAFRVDFDDQKDVVREFGAQMQSTLIVFRNGVEVGRSVGDTDPASIEALLAKTA
jgi:thioredoxin 1